MACGSATWRWALAASILLGGPWVAPEAAHARKHRQPPQQQPTQQPGLAAPPPAAPEHALPALVVPPNAAPEPAIVLAPEPAAPVEPPKVPRWMLGARAGVLFPQPFAPVGTTGQGALEVGYLLLPQLQLVGVLSYAQTQRSQVGTDLRLAAATYRATATSHQAGLALGAMGRLFDLDARVNPTLTVALQLLLQNLQQEGSAGGADFGVTSQNSLQAGVYAATGVEVRAGPGRVLIEASVTWVPTARAAPTGDRLGGVGGNLGYRLAL